jgi:ribosome biogenesis GTPase A
MGFWPVVLNVIRNSDIVLLIVDARMPELTQNSEIISKAEALNKRVTVVFTKCDLVGKKEKELLKETYPNTHLVSGLKKTGVKDLKKYLENAADNWNQNSLRVGVVGYPNVGKSTLINLIIPGAKAKVSSVSGTTKKTQWIRSKNLRIMDSPGVIPFEDKNAKLGLTASKDPHKLRNPEFIALKIIGYLVGKKKGVLGRFYGIEEEGDGYALILAIGKKRGYLQKGGEVDEHRTAIRIIDDWQKGKISLK